MECLYVIVCFLLIIVQIYSIIVLKKAKDNNYWNLFVGITIAGFISVILAYISLSSAALGLGDGILCLLVMAIGFIANTIMLIIGLIAKRKIQDDGIKLNKSFVLVSALAVGLYAIVLWVVPAVSHKIDTGKGEKVVLDYLDDKYGEGNYKVLNVYSEYTSNGITDKSVTGYYYEIKSSYMNNTFFVLVNDDDYKIRQDYFLPVYFSQKNNLSYELEYDNGFYKRLNENFENFDDYLIGIIEENHPQVVGEITRYDIYQIYGNYSYVDGSGSSAVTGYSWNFNIIPSDFGKIPTIEELSDRAYIYLK